MATLNFNANEAPDIDFEPIPECWLPGFISKSDLKQNKKQNGTYLELVWKITGENQYKNRTIFDRITIQHDNDTAVRIGQGTLKKIVQATRSDPHVRNSAELHNKPCQIKIAVRQYKDKDGNTQYGNEIKDYKATGKATGAPTIAAADASKQSGFPSNVFDD